MTDLMRGTVPSLMLVSALLACTAREQPPAATESGRAALEAYVDAWNRHDSLALDTLMTADGVHEDLAQGFRGQGSAQVREFMRGLIAAEPDFKWTLTSVFESGSRVAAEWTWRSTYTGPSPIGPVVNQPISGRGSSVVDIEGGKIKRLTDYYDIASYFPRPAADSVKP